MFVPVCNTQRPNKQNKRRRYLIILVCVSLYSRILAYQTMENAQKETFSCIIASIRLDFAIK